MNKMKKKSCSYEGEIRKSLFTGDIDPAMKNHLATCPICRDTVLVFQWMEDFQNFKKEKELPTFENIWVDASSSSRLDKELVRKVIKPLIIPKIVSIILTIVVPVYLVFLNLKGIKDLIKSSVASSLIYTSLVSTFKTFSKMSLYLVPVMGISLLTIIVFIFITGFKPKKRGLFNP